MAIDYPCDRRIKAMSYVVLARKYRPRTFAQMVGQEHVVQALSNALTQQRLHHAYLFTGTRGIGKTTVSRILAKSLNCTGPDGQGGITATPCGQCQACTEIDADRFLDYIELDAASNRGIEEVRDMIERAAYKPGVGRFKVFMIDEAHQLTKEAFNALLKTLEEPPDYLKFVLATTDPDKMLPTVLSRCLQFNLRPMAPATVREHLQSVLAAEGVQHDEPSLALLARAARGSMRDALSLTDQAIAYGAGQLSQAVVRNMLGSVDRSHTLALVQALSAQDGAAVLATVDGLRQLGLSASATLDELALLLQHMAIEQTVPGALDREDPELASACQAAPLLAADETQLLYSMALQGRDELHLVSDEYAGLTMVLLRFLAFSGRAGPDASAAQVQASPREVRTAPLRSPAAPSLTVAPAAQQGPAPVLSTANRVAQSEASARAPAVVPVPAAVLAPPAEALAAAPVAKPGAAALAAVPDKALGDDWSACVKRLCDAGLVSALVRELAMQSDLTATDTTVEPQCWSLRVALEPLRNPVLSDKLAAALSTELGFAVVLDVQPGAAQDSPALRDLAERQRRQAAAEARIAQDPVVLELLAQFQGARIVPGSVKPL
jgi:DNA polymerase III subunit gamma/tau